MENRFKSGDPVILSNDNGVTVPVGSRGKILELDRLGRFYRVDFNGIIQSVMENQLSTIAEWWKEKSLSPITEITLVTPQSLPTSSNAPFVWDLVLADIQGREDYGMKKYKTRLKANNGRDPLVDAYQESLDMCVYLRQAIYEKYGK
jgi:hypothetical protein